MSKLKIANSINLVTNKFYDQRKKRWQKIYMENETFRKLKTFSSYLRFSESTHKTPSAKNKNNIFFKIKCF